jgi:hypothetical protein
VCAFHRHAEVERATRLALEFDIEARKVASPDVFSGSGDGPARQENSMTHPANLPRIPAATDAEVLFFSERRALHGCGIGYIDAHHLTAVAS